MKRISFLGLDRATLGLALAGATLAPTTASAFCGFFVAAADAQMFNNASQVVIAHDEDNTVLTMVNNYRGEPRAFALVVPVPVVLEKELVRVIDMKSVDHLDAFSAPRLAEYHDPDPCMEVRYERAKVASAPSRADEGAMAGAVKKRDLGVTVEATYTVGEYDIVILSAKQSDGLEIWLRQEKYNIPAGAARALAPYVRSGMKFFVAKVNLEEQAKGGFTTLRPLQFAYPDERFMLPVRLGMLNADGDQDIIAYVISRKFRTEVTNYKSARVPTDVNIPTFIKSDFKRFYKDMFSRQVQKQKGKAVFTEYAWNMTWCDPCASDPLSIDELESLGVWWMRPEGESRPAPPGDLPGLKRAILQRIKTLSQNGSPDVPALVAQFADAGDDPAALRRIYDAAWPAAPQRPSGPVEAYVTRLHARYNANTFPEDLVLKVTQDASNFQGRYIMTHPHAGGDWCEAKQGYIQRVLDRREQEIKTLSDLTGWSPQEIRPKMVPFEGGTPSRPQNDGWREKMKKFFGGR